MSENRKLAAILCSDVVGYSRLAGADEDRILARLRALRSDLIDPTIAVHHGRIVKRTGDGSIVEFRSVVDAVRCAIEVQNTMVERNAGVPEDRRIVFRIGIHLGDVVEESDGDLMGDGVNIAARLEGVAAPGAICLSEDAYRQVKGRLDLAVTDLGPTQLKNIAEPVRAYSLQVGVSAVTKPATGAKPTGSKKSKRALPLAAALILIVGGTGYFVLRSQTASVVPSAEAPRRSIVVLPFANLSNDPEQDYFADGITDDLTTDVSHLSGSFVIARNTAFSYKGKAVDAKQIGREHDVRYMLEGSVRRVGDKITVNAQLISTETGAHLWADHFEGERSGLGELQVEFVGRLANALNWELIRADTLRSRRGRPNNLDAVDFSLRGWDLWDHLDTPEVHAQIVDNFEKALKLDPQLPEAQAGLSEELTVGVEVGYSAHPTEESDRALALASQALATHPDYAEAHNAKALNLRDRGQHDAAMAEAEAAIALDPNNALSHGIAGNLKMNQGRAAEGFAELEKALRLSPRDPWAGIWEMQICYLHEHLAQWDKAIEWCRKGIATYPDFFAYGLIAAAYSWTGKDADARVAVSEALKIKPDYTVRFFMEGEKKSSDNPTFRRELEPIIQGLRKAGLPEG